MRKFFFRLKSWFSLTRRERRVILFLICSVLIGQIVLFIKRKRKDFAHDLVVTERLSIEQLMKKSDSLAAVGREYLRVDINSATVEELQLLPGVGEATARRIITYREERGRFRDPRDLIHVRGIGETKYAAMRECIVVRP
jgi:competence ComEA-like helix-hairpin-helix protein